MFGSLIYAVGPWFPNPLWTSSEIQCRHLQGQVRRGDVGAWASLAVLLSTCTLDRPFWSPLLEERA